MQRTVVTALLASLITLVPTQLFAIDAPLARTSDEIGASLRADPVLVQPLMGMGATDQVDAELTRLAEAVDLPVWVILAQTPDDLLGAERPAEQLAAVLRTELGDGLYVVALARDSIFIDATGPARGLDTAAAYAAMRRAEEIGPGEYPQTSAAMDAALILMSAADSGASVGDTAIREVAAHPWAYVPNELHERADRLAGRLVWTVGGAMTLGAGMLTLVLLSRRSPMPPRRTARSRRPAPAAPETIDNWAAEAAELLARVRRSFDALADHDLASPHARAATDAIQAAEHVLRTGDHADVIGALVLARTAEHELLRISRPRLRPLVPCAIDPLHERARDTTPLTGSALDVPVCAHCLRRAGEVRHIPTWRGPRPYLQTRSVWARTGYGALVDDLAIHVLADRGLR